MATDIIETVAQNPVTVLIDEKAYSEFYARVKEQVSAHVPDVTTKKGRDEIKSLAYKVVRSKTAIDDAGKKLNEEARAKINAVDAQRRKIREELDALADEVRKPLTDWEDAEKQRTDTMASVMLAITTASTIQVGASSDDIAKAIEDVAAIFIYREIFGEEYDMAEDRRQMTLTALRNHHSDALRREEDARELARLREEAAERDRIERERAERERLATEEAERIERARQEAEERDRRIAEDARIKAEQEAAARIAAAEAEARRIKEDAERAERERQEAVERMKREEDARRQDREHRSRVMRLAKEAIMTHGVDEDAAKKIVLAIIADEIPNVSMRF